jgi:hypothetical protein
MKPDPVSLWSGAIVAALGVLVLLDCAGALDVSLGWIAATLTAGVGGILLVSGLTNQGTNKGANQGTHKGGERHD